MCVRMILFENPPRADFSGTDVTSALNKNSRCRFENAHTGIFKTTSQSFRTLIRSSTSASTSARGRPGSIRSPTRRVIVPDFFQSR